MKNDEGRMMKYFLHLQLSHFRLSPTSASLPLPPLSNSSNLPSWRINDVEVNAVILQIVAFIANSD